MRKHVKDIDKELRGDVSYAKRTTIDEEAPKSEDENSKILIGCSGYGKIEIKNCENSENSTEVLFKP